MVPIRSSIQLAKKNLFRLQFISDLHLEINIIKDYNSIIKPIAPYLALVGDIGHYKHESYKPFFDYVSSNFEKVFYVPGNHEFYSDPYNRNQIKTMEEIEYNMKLLTNLYKNVYYMNRTHHRIEELNVGIVGAPLWTPKFSSKNIFIAKDESLESHQSNHMHQLDYTYIDEYCRRFARTNTSTVILTHFMPSFSLIPTKYLNYPKKENFASNSDFLFQHPIKCWIYGHTHQASTHIINKTLAITNPYGYKSQHNNNGFCNQMFVEFKLPTNEEEDENIFIKELK
jgi:predicted phosphodiesterase